MSSLLLNRRCCATFRFAGSLCSCSLPNLWEGPLCSWLSLSCLWNLGEGVPGALCSWRKCVFGRVFSGRLKRSFANGIGGFSDRSYRVSGRANLAAGFGRSLGVRGFEKELLFCARSFSVRGFE